MNNLSPKDAKLVGSRVTRREDDQLLRGRARFIDDVPVPAGTLYLSFLRSPYGHARITEIDTEEALAAPGVVAIYTGKQIEALTKPLETPVVPGGGTMVRPNMATEVVRHVGETVAVVVAETPEQAEDALELIFADFDPLDTVTTIPEATRDGAPRVHDYLDGNVVFESRYQLDEVEDIFDTAPHVMGDTFSSGRVSAVAMECRGFLTSYDAGRKRLHHVSSAQFPHKMRAELAQALDMPEHTVQVVAPTVGGSFGMKTVTFPEDFVGAVIARDLGRPIKWLQDRPDDLALMHARDFHFTVEIACDHDGRLLGVRGGFDVDLGAYPYWIATAGLEAAGAGHHMMGAYKTPAYGYVARSIVTNKAPLVSYRGVAAPICVLGMETLMDRMGAKLGIDRVEIRKRNLIRPEDLPYRNRVGITHDTASHIACLDKALEAIDYDNYIATRSDGLNPDGKYRGLGIVTITDHTGQGTSIARSRGQASRTPGHDSARLRVEPDGSIHVATSFASQGQGHQTVFAQIVADQLGVAIERVTIEEADTATSPFGTGSSASRGAVVGGSAVLKAAGTVAAKIRRIAAHMLEVAPDQIELADNRITATGPSNRFLDLGEVAATAYMISTAELPPGETVGLEATETFDPTTSVYSNATHAVMVAVDADTGLVDIERYVVVHDCGRVLNPMIVEGQVIGAVAQGIGSVLTEAVRYDDTGQPLATTLLDYGIPTFLDVPEIELSHVVTPSTANPLGLKGAGEGGIVGAVPALSLAIADALRDFDVSFSSVPILPARLVDIIHPEA
jgi:carbon-monoxide dehydrogenase large subunit